MSRVKSNKMEGSRVLIWSLFIMYCIMVYNEMPMVSGNLLICEIVSFLRFHQFNKGILFLQNHVCFWYQIDATLPSFVVTAFPPHS